MWAAVLAAAAALAPPPAEPVRLLVVGGTPGHLEPCGCTKPMSGGLARRVAVLRALAGGKGSLVVDVGPVLKEAGRQSEIKLETLCEAMAPVGDWALALGPAEAALGPGALLSAQRLAGGALTTLAAGPQDAEVAAQHVATSVFLFGSESAGMAQSVQAAGLSPVAGDRVAWLVREAAERRLRAVLSTDGGAERARQLAQAHPGLFAVAYRSSGAPSSALEKEGSVYLVGSGDRGRFVSALEWRAGLDQPPSVRVVELGPGVADDPEARAALLQYKRRLAEERLLDMAPRFPGPAFAGNKACGSCHADADKAWRASKHSQALRTLEADGSDADPDCVGCHVVGLGSETGFRSRKTTPDRADVGCESCHGPGVEHAARPYEARMPKVGKASCAPCHNAEHSPGFDFDTAWPKVAH